jgi:hypothetical protein
MFQGERKARTSATKLELQAQGARLKSRERPSAVAICRAMGPIAPRTPNWAPFTRPGRRRYNLTGRRRTFRHARRPAHHLLAHLVADRNNFEFAKKKSNFEFSIFNTDMWVPYGLEAGTSSTHCAPGPTSQAANHDAPLRRPLLSRSLAPRRGGARSSQTKASLVASFACFPAASVYLSPRRLPPPAPPLLLGSPSRP